MMIRAAEIKDVDAIAKVHVDTWRSTYTGLIPREYLDQLSYSKRSEMWVKILSNSKPKEANLVATIGDRVIGFAGTGPNRTQSINYEGELYAIYLLQEYHGRGFGQSLFQRSVDCLLDYGFQSMVVWVLKDNPACRFYEAMGGLPVDEKYDEIGGSKVLEIAYGWNHLKRRKDFL